MVFFIVCHVNLHGGVKLFPWWAPLSLLEWLAVFGAVRSGPMPFLSALKTQFVLSAPVHLCLRWSLAWSCRIEFHGLRPMALLFFLRFLCVSRLVVPLPFEGSLVQPVVYAY